MERADCFLTELESAEWRLRPPLRLWRTESGAGHVVGTHVVQACGMGDTEDEAVEDYCRNLIELVERTARMMQRLLSILEANECYSEEGQRWHC